MVGMLLRYTISYDRRKGGLLGESPFANPQPFCQSVRTAVCSHTTKASGSLWG